MKLYEIPRDSKIRLDLITEICIFRHIDGMYSLIETPKGTAIHLGASTEIKLGEDGIYELAD